MSRLRSFLKPAFGLVFVWGFALAAPAQAAVSQAELQASLNQRGLVQLPAGELVLSRPLVVPARTTLRGAGKGVTVLRMAEGANADVLQTEDFEALKGSQRLAEAPSDITIEGLTVDGGFLSGRWTDPQRKVLNTRGSCIVAFARRLRLDVETNNCPQHMLYSEGQGPRESQEVAAQIRLSGLVAGEECVVFRGPGDSRVESLSAGVCGAKRLQPTLASIVSSVVAGAEGFDALVIDRTSPYEGTLEIGYAHLFGTFSGWGLRTKGSPRLHVTHLVSESNRGGAYIDRDTWGAIDLLDVHSNGKSAPGAPANPWPGLEVRSVHGFSVARGLVARTAGSGEGFPAAVLSGQGGQFALAVMNTRDAGASRDHAGDAVWLAGKGNVLTLTAWRLQGLALKVSGDHNVATLAVDGEVVDTGTSNRILSTGPANPGARLKDSP